MDNQNSKQTKPQIETNEGFPFQLKLLIIGIIIGLAVLVLEFAGFLDR